MKPDALTAVVSLLQYTRGLCADQVPHEQIDVKLDEAIEMVCQLRDGPDDA